MNRKHIFGVFVAFLLAVTLIFGTQVNSASAQTSTSGVPIGTVTTYAGSVKDSARAVLERQGWLVCDGQTVRRTDYADLFKVIGNIYGSGDNISTFNLPDLRGRFVRGVDNGKGRDPDAKSRTASGLGGNTGDNVGSVQGFQVQNHKHEITDFGSGGSGRADWNNAFSTSGLTGGDGTVRRSSNTEAINKYGGNETRPINIYLNYIIKAKNV